MKNKKLIIGIIVCAVLIVAAIAAAVMIMTGSTEGTGIVNTEESKPAEGSSIREESVEFKKDELETFSAVENDELDENTIKLNKDSVSYNGEGVSIDNTDIIIKEDGEYYVTGTLDNGRIIVDADSDADVTIVLSGVDITSKNSAAIYVKSADKVILALADGTKNIITDGGDNYAYDDSANEEPNAAVFSKDDLVISGTGELTVNGGFNNGIASKDDLRITGGIITVNAVNNGIKGKDCVAIADGNITIDAGGDAIKSDNATDEEQGFIYISAGTFNITAGEDGMQAENDIEITDGTFTIKTGEGSAVTSAGNNDWGMPGFGGMDQQSASTDTASIKGIKAAKAITINGGTFTFDTEDDALHSNTDLVINKGTLNIASGDDGMHADSNLTISDGTVNITKSYEGIEATYINICGGTIDIVASDDGLNAAGGNDSSSMNRPGMGMFESGTGQITFEGGTLTMDASGDGVDSNGSVVYKDGTVTVHGPTNSGNGAMDYGATWVQTGGTFVAAGASGMAQMPSNASKQNSLMVTFETSYGSGDVITIKDSADNTILEYTAKKSFNNIVVCIPELKTGETYKILTNGTEYETFTIESVCTTIGNAGGFGGPGGQGGFGGQGGPGNKGGFDGQKPDRR